MVEFVVEFCEVVVGDDFGSCEVLEFCGVGFGFGCEVDEFESVI